MPPPLSSDDNASARANAAAVSRRSQHVGLDDANSPVWRLDSNDGLYFSPPSPRRLDAEWRDDADSGSRGFNEGNYEDEQQDEAMPDIRGSFFDTTTSTPIRNAFLDQQRQTRSQLQRNNALAERDAYAGYIPDNHRPAGDREIFPQQHQNSQRQPYTDATSFVYGEPPSWPSVESRSPPIPPPSNARTTLPAHLQPPITGTLPQTEAQRFAIAHSSRRASLASMLRRAQPPTYQPSPTTADAGLRPRPTLPAHSRAWENRDVSRDEPRPTLPDLRSRTWEHREDMSGSYTGRPENDTHNADYTGWAPGTSTAEHQRPTLNTLRAMARGHRTDVTAREENDSSETRTPGRSAAMTQLERRYWAEQERQRRRHLEIVAAEQEAVARRWERGIRPSIWAPSNPVPVDINAHPIDTEANGQLPNPQSIIYNRPNGDVDDLFNRTWEEVREGREDAYGPTSLNRRARRELQRTRRTVPDEVRRDELRRGLYDLHRDRHPDVQGGSEPVRRDMEEGIRYLQNLRECGSPEQAYRAAEEGGLIVNGRSACDLADFIFDPKIVEKTPWTSWLVPGTRFSGFQHAVTVSALPSYSASHTSTGNQTARTRHMNEYPHASRIPTATASSNPHSSTFRPSWIESVMQRDRHAGATQNHGPREPTATLPSSGPSSLLNSIPATFLPHTPQLTQHIRTENEDTWPVKVTITSVDYDKCTLTGTMEAMNVPNKQSPVRSSSQTSSNSASTSDQTTITTFLEGEIIDLNTHTLETCGFNADSSVDSTYWRRLDPFKTLGDKELPSKLVSSKWLKSKIGEEWVLMRWKEKCFVTPSDAGMGLTISGFYYISLQRATGRIEGLYYDPQSSPYQHLCLEPQRVRQFSTYTFQ